MTTARAVSFDFGQTLADLDHELLARRCAERGALLSPERLATETSAAWLAYGEAKRAGLKGRDAWCAFMSTLLARAGERDQARALAEWLFDEQPKRNLWQKPIAGMFELVAELEEAGTPLGIISNSEGRLLELVDELGYSSLFSVIADSGRLGFEKPDRRIFDFAAARLGIATEELVHVGDAWETDVVGALEVGARAVWFAPAEERPLPERVLAARNADEVRAALRSFGVVG